MAMSISPGSHLDSQKGQAPYSTDFLEPDELNVRVSRNPEVGESTGHQPFVRDNRPLPMSSEACERLEGRATYVSKVPVDIEGIPKPLNCQEGDHCRNFGSNPDSRDGNRETDHRATPAVKRTVTVRTCANKVSYSCQSLSSCLLKRSIRNGNTIKGID